MRSSKEAAQFIAGLGGAGALPLSAWAQPAERVRRLGVPMSRSDAGQPHDNFITLV
jgi:hypothetical protein